MKVRIWRDPRTRWWWCTRVDHPETHWNPMGMGWNASLAYADYRWKLS